MKKSLLLILLFGYLVSYSQEAKVPYAWLAGSWVGDGFGGTSEEVWSEPSLSGTMMGVYRHHKGDGSLNFYEFLTLDSTGIKLKHFTPKLTAWETKEDFVHFELIEFTENKIILKGLVFERKSDSEMEIRLDLKNGDKQWTEVFKMKRK
ncbi:DUF6265 family protein [Ekhidna sp.]|uniref:DUF6265 family protein n=1 Tax=Ekhidna sp. TaxID=2608089 RepID=UPI003CCB8B34